MPTNYELRLECLRLAHNRDALDESVIRTAKAYFAFVEGRGDDSKKLAAARAALRE